MVIFILIVIGLIALYQFALALKKEKTTTTTIRNNSNTIDHSNNWRKYKVGDEIYTKSYIYIPEGTTMVSSTFVGELQAASEKGVYVMDIIKGEITFYDIQDYFIVNKTFDNSIIKNKFKEDKEIFDEMQKMNFEDFKL
jgi:hypothetical protein